MQAAAGGALNAIRAGAASAKGAQGCQQLLHITQADLEDLCAKLRSGDLSGEAAAAALESCAEVDEGPEAFPRKAQVVQVLPSVPPFEESGNEVYRAGDEGRVLCSPYRDDSGDKRFEVKWQRTGRVCRLDRSWSEKVQVVGDLPLVGEEVQALPDNTEGGAIFKPGDRGRVSTPPFLRTVDKTVQVRVTWYGSGEGSYLILEDWMTKVAVTGRARTLALGDEVEAFANAGLADERGVILEAGDVGKVSTAPYKCIDVDCWWKLIKESSNKGGNFIYRTQGGEPTGRVVPSGSYVKGSETFTDERGIVWLKLADGRGWIRLMDIHGAATAAKSKEVGEDVLIVQITWYKSGRTSTHPVSGWMYDFRLLEHDGANSKLVNDADLDVIEKAVESKQAAQGKPMELISGQPKGAAQGLFHFMRVKDPLGEDTADRMEKEIKDFTKELKERAMFLTMLKSDPARQASTADKPSRKLYGEEDIEYFRKAAGLREDASPLMIAEKVEEELLGNLNYILYEKASELFVEGPNAIRDRDRGPVAIKFFMDHKNVKYAELTKAHVVALRLYTTPAYKYLNSPLRSLDFFYHRDKPHPLPLTMTYISEGIKKLRTAYAVQVEEGTAKAQLSLWRGLKNMKMSEDFLKNRRGGTELAPMSTTSDLEVAAKYACSGESILFKISLDNFMQYGADLQWLSAFPGEAEVLYPPLTYLQPTDRPPQIVETKMGHQFTVYEVKPTLP